MKPEEEIQELKSIIQNQGKMLNRAIRALEIQKECYTYYFNRWSFYLTHKPIAEYVEEEVQKEKERKKQFYPGYPGIPKGTLDQKPDKGTDKK